MCVCVVGVLRTMINKYLILELRQSLCSLGTSLSYFHSISIAFSSNIPFLFTVLANCARITRNCPTVYRIFMQSAKNCYRMWQTTFQFFLEYEKCTSLCALWVTASNFSSSFGLGPASVSEGAAQRKELLAKKLHVCPLHLSPPRFYCLLQKFFYSFVKR